jgi:hypothetical protein
VTIPLPPPGKAPGFRDAVGPMASMRAGEVADGWLAIARPRGAGTVYPYFTLEGLPGGGRRSTESTMKYRYLACPRYSSGQTSATRYEFWT